MFATYPRQDIAAPNAQGALGLADPRDAYEPELVPLSGFPTLCHIAAGHYHSLITAQDGSVWSCGWVQPKDPLLAQSIELLPISLGKCLEFAFWGCRS